MPKKEPTRMISPGPSTRYRDIGPDSEGCFLVAPEDIDAHLKEGWKKYKPKPAPKKGDQKEVTK